MNVRHQISRMAALALVSCLGLGAAMMPAPQEPDQPPAKTPAQPPAQEMPPMPPAPGEHHKWLEQLVGEWTVESEMIPPGMDPIKSKGTDSVRSIGGRWIVAELTNEIPGLGAMQAIMTLGYDSEKSKYQGTWVDSIQDHMWIYTGTIDATGKILTLEAEGPNMMDPSGPPGKYRDVIEIKSADQRTLTSSGFMDGKWVQFGVSTYRRTKAAAGGDAAPASGTAMNILTSKPIELGCGSCIYKMAGVQGCTLAAKVGDKNYLVAGKHGLNPHDFCGKGKPATVTGTIEGETLVITAVTMN